MSDKLERRLSVYTKQRRSRGTRAAAPPDTLSPPIEIVGIPRRRLQSIQDELQKLQRIPVLALLPVPAHNWNLRPGALGKVHLQLCPFLRHRHGGLHLLRLHTHPRASGAGIFPRDLWGPT